MNVPQEITRLVETFQLHSEHYKSNIYKETQLRREFIDPLFKALGWDIDNQHGYADAYKDVIHEDAIKIGGRAKAPDYCFRIGGTRKFFVEAKKPAVHIKTDAGPAFQLRRYAWSAKLPISILTDFEEFSVYDCRIRPSKVDPAAKARTLYINFKNYTAAWNDIASIFSRDAILKGSFDKYVFTSTNKRGTSEVDSEFLVEITKWHEMLARNFALRNRNLSVKDLNFSVQKTLDRIIFLRMCEDRGTEDYGRMLALRGRKNIYNALLELCQQADNRYNSGLFHFQSETGRPGAPDQLTPSLLLDDKVLNEIISNLYYPDSPYEFSVLPADILGHVYEQLLGKTIRLTVNHQAKIEDKPNVRKAGGVYYTPTYIVDHMIENTLGRLLNGRNSNSRNPLPVVQAANIKVIDPACGSGSFLIVAYQYLLDWHRDQYTLDLETGELDPGKIRRHARGRKPKIYQASGGEYRLTTTERKRILLNNIFGVDIDSQAVEVTKLSLLLKVLENETQEQLQRDFISARERILPDLGFNIRCGNSIIGTDYYDQVDLVNISEEVHARINVFDWRVSFKDIFDRGGFDCVIGNPPYVDIKDHPQEDVEYIFRTYQCADNRINLFSTFMEKALDLVRGNNSYISFVVPTSILSQSSYAALRDKLLEMASLESLVRLPNEPFGSAAGQVKVDAVVVTLSVPKERGKCTDIVAYRGYDRITQIDSRSAHVSGSVSTDRLRSMVGGAWSINTTDAHIALIDKLEAKGSPLSEFVEFCLGLTPYDRYRGHSRSQIENKVFHSDHKKDPTFKRLLKGSDVKRYAITWSGGSWISYGPWLGAPRQQRFFTERRILVKQIIDWTSLRIWAALTEKELYNTQNAFNLLAKSDTSLYYILGILNSKLMNFYHAKKFLDEFKMRFQKILIQNAKSFPIRRIDSSQPSVVELRRQLIELVVSIQELQGKITLETNPEEMRQLSQLFKVTDQRIDEVVYRLYDLTADEIELVESQMLI